MLLSDEILNEICRLYQLGSLIAPIQFVSGGLNQVFLLTTTRGQYILKKIDKTNAKLLHPNLVSAECAQKIASFMLTKNVPTICALTHDKSYVYTNQQQFLVFPWVKGKAFTDEDITPEMIEKIGAVLAKIHLAKFDLPENFSHWQGLHEEQWSALIARLPAQLSEPFRLLIPCLVDFSEQARMANGWLNSNCVMSHRDFDARNVLWQEDGSPILLDWDYVGPINPQLDLFLLAMNWSGILTKTFSQEKYLAALRGYRTLKEIEYPDCTHVIPGYIGYCLDWLIFNLRKLTLHPSSADCVSQIHNTLRVIRFVARNKDYFSGIISC